MNLLQTIDLTAVFGIIAVIVAATILIFKAVKAPKGILCTECGKRRVTLVSKKQTKFMTSDYGGESGGGTTQIRYMLTYKCPDCLAENTFESGVDT